MKRNALVMSLCFTALAFSVEQVKSWEPPLEVDISCIWFDYEAGYSNDGLNIRKNASTDIARPEWVPYSGRNDPFAYIKGQTNRRIHTDLYHNQDEMEICNIHVRTEATGDPPGTIAETRIYFPACGQFVSNATLTMTNGAVPAYVHKFGFNYSWYVTRVNGETLDTPIYFGVTGTHSYYILLAAPQAPMAEPWTDVLEYACAWAAGQSSESGAASEITVDAYTSFGKNYYGGGTHASGTTLHLTSLFASSWADCRDMSATVHAFVRALGGSQTNVRMIDDTGYAEDLKYKSIDPVGSPSWTTGWWNFHQVTNLSGVCDACLRLNQSSPRIPVGEDINGSYKNDLFDPVTGSVWVPKNPFAYQSVD